MKILFICDVDIDNKDAQNIHIMELFNNLCKVADVCLLTPKPKKIKHNLFNIKYVYRLFIPPLGLISYQISLFFHLYYYCKKIKVDAFYVRQSDFSFMPLIVSKYFRIPYFVEVNGLITDEMKMFKKTKLSIAFTKLSEKLGYKHANKIIAVAQGIKDGIIELYSVPDEKIVVIENGANIELFKPMDQEQAKKELNLDKDINYVCFVGNLAPWQGVEYLIQAAPSILVSCTNIRFLIVGNGPMKNEWIQYAQKLGVYDKFIFTGSVPYEQVPLYINSGLVCIAPFKKDRIASPMKIYEYLACNKPVVASNIPGISDLLNNSGGGIAVTPENPEELADAVIKILKDKKFRENMTEKGRKYILKYHTWENVAKRVFEILVDTETRMKANENK